MTRWSHVKLEDDADPFSPVARAARREAGAVTDILHLDATAQADLVRSRDISPSELVDAAIDAVERINPQLNAVIHERFDKARQEAAGELPDGPFRGVPMVVKDLSLEMTGDPIHEGTTYLKRLGHTADHDTELAARFRRAGFVVVGRTNTPELGILPTTEPRAYGPTRNPWDPGRSTGGSSGGSAAAVAARMVAVGHANDGGGSIRIPASECGLVGLKPSRARVSLAPDYGDVMGGLVAELAVTRSVRDAAIVLDAVHGPATGDPYDAPPPSRPYRDEVGADPGKLRIGLTSSLGGTVAQPECVAALDAAGLLLESLGHHVDASHPTALDDPAYTGHFLNLWAAGNAWAIDYWVRQTGVPLEPGDLEPASQALVDLGRSISGPDWLWAREWLQATSRRTLAWWDDDGWDLLATPTIAEVPPELGSFDGDPDQPLFALFRAGALVPFTPQFNVTGQPAISLPLHWSAEGLPVGVQLVANRGREDVLLAVAAQLEAAAPWADRIPPIHA
ncbi:MAG: nylA [Acidimicrobiales bacterium]|nr:nylA [Acidimicrobiales bacterium]